MSRGGARAGAGRKKGGSDRPKKHLKSLLQKHTEKAVKVLVDGLSDDNSKIRQDAAKEIIHLAYGKPSQAITGDDGGDIQITLNKIIHSAAD